MRGLMNLLALLFLIILIYVIYRVFKQELRDEAKQKRERLLKERERRMNENKEKERLRDLLENRCRKWLYPGYTALLLAFGGLSIIISVIFFTGFEFGGFLYGATVTEAGILVVTLFAFRKPFEFKHILTQFESNLKKLIYGDNINISSEIELNYVRIAEIDEEVKKLDELIVA